MKESANIVLRFGKIYKYAAGVIVPSRTKNSGLALRVFTDFLLPPAPEHLYRIHCRDVMHFVRDTAENPSSAKSLCSLNCGVCPPD